MRNKNTFPTPSRLSLNGKDSLSYGDSSRHYVSDFTPPRKTRFRLISAETERALSSHAPKDAQ